METNSKKDQPNPATKEKKVSKVDKAAMEASKKKKQQALANHQTVRK